MSVKRHQEALDDAYTAMNIDSSNPKVVYQIFQTYIELDDRQTADSLHDFNRYLYYELASRATASPLIGTNLAVLKNLMTGDAQNARKQAEPMLYFEKCWSWQSSVDRESHVDLRATPENIHAVSPGGTSQVNIEHFTSLPELRSVNNHPDGSWVGETSDGQKEQHLISDDSLSDTESDANSTELEDETEEKSLCGAKDNIEEVVTRGDPVNIGNEAPEGSRHKVRTDSIENGRTNRNFVDDTARNIENNNISGKGGSRRGKPLLKKDDEYCAALMIPKKIVERGNASRAGRAIQDAGQAKGTGRHRAAKEVPSKALKAKSVSRDDLRGGRRVEPIERLTLSGREGEEDQLVRRAVLLLQEDQGTEREISRRRTDERRPSSTEGVAHRRTLGQKRRSGYHVPVSLCKPFAQDAQQTKTMSKGAGSLKQTEKLGNWKEILQAAKSRRDVKASALAQDHMVVFGR